MALKEVSTIVDRNFICKVFGISTPTLKRWTDLGLQKAAHGAYDMAVVHEWFMGNIADAGKDSCHDTPDIAEAKRFYWDIKGKREELKLQEETGSLLQKALVERDAMKAGRAIRDALQGIADRTAAQVAGSSDQFECRRILQIEIKHILGDLTNVLTISE